MITYPDLTPSEQEEFHDLVSIYVNKGFLMPEDAEEAAFIRIQRRRDGLE